MTRVFYLVPTEIAEQFFLDEEYAWIDVEVSLTGVPEFVVGEDAYLQQYAIEKGHGCYRKLITKPKVFDHLLTNEDVIEYIKGEAKKRRLMQSDIDRHDMAGDRNLTNLLKRFM